MFRSILATTVVYLTVVIGVHRYVAVRYLKDAFGTNDPQYKKGALMFLLSFVVATLINLPKFLEVKVHRHEMGNGEFFEALGMSDLRSDPLYVIFYVHWFR